MASITFPSHAKSIIVSDGTRYGYINIVPQPGQPTLLFLHGYPSSSYHWHNQIQQCIAAGYGLIAPDLLGYGDTDKPTDIAAYDNTVMAKHVIEILDHEKVLKAIGVSHDWGATFLSTVARVYPDRFSLLVFLAVGYLPTQAVLTDVDAINAQAKQLIGRPIFGYWHFHNKSEAASLLENSDPLVAASLLFPADPSVWITSVCEPGGMEAWVREKKTSEVAPWISPEELETHGKILKAGGFTGPLNWYKQAMAGITHKSEARINPKYAETKFTTPTLLVGCNKDVICIPALQEAGMKDFFTNLTVKTLDTGHWCMLEKPNEVWGIVHGWIEENGKGF